MLTPWLIEDYKDKWFSSETDSESETEAESTESETESKETEGKREEHKRPREKSPESIAKRKADEIIVQAVLGALFNYK